MRESPLELGGLQSQWTSILNPMIFETETDTQNTDILFPAARDLLCGNSIAFADNTGSIFLYKISGKFLDMRRDHCLMSPIKILFIITY
jgi:hypothetical protein